MDDRVPRAYLFIAPWIFGTSEDEASSANAWIVGACLVAATLRVKAPRDLPTATR